MRKLATSLLMAFGCFAFSSAYAQDAQDPVGAEIAGGDCDASCPTNPGLLFHGDGCGCGKGKK